MIDLLPVKILTRRGKCDTRWRVCNLIPDYHLNYLRSSSTPLNLALQGEPWFLYWTFHVDLQYSYIPLLSKSRFGAQGIWETLIRDSSHSTEAVTADVDNEIPTIHVPDALNSLKKLNANRNPDGNDLATFFVQGRMHCGRKFGVDKGDRRKTIWRNMGRQLTLAFFIERFMLLLSRNVRFTLSVMALFFDRDYCLIYLLLYR